ncbi:uncharacterized protein LOC131936504 [Physella acuta]|uniref:uncharacterized protein LOC131936504 n=1 Tax=Physella acuta TaxID=109671 RepID=UPI0027DE81AA|nr:uncharacterized protein LOC131936504 [Physella acuta]
MSLCFLLLTVVTWASALSAPTEVPINHMEAFLPTKLYNKVKEAAEEALLDAESKIKYLRDVYFNDTDWSDEGLVRSKFDEMPCEYCIVCFATQRPVPCDEACGKRCPEETGDADRKKRADLLGGLTGGLLGGGGQGGLLGGLTGGLLGGGGQGGLLGGLTGGLLGGGGQGGLLGGLLGGPGGLLGGLTGPKGLIPSLIPIPEVTQLLCGADQNKAAQRTAAGSGSLLGGLPVVGGLASNLLGTATNLVGGLPLVGSLAGGLLGNAGGSAGGLGGLGSLLGGLGR